MKGDFSRRTFDRAKHYAGVLMQQGRVSVDADWNEEQEIARYRVKTETVDVVGRCGTPLDPPDYTEASGFALALSPGNTSITIGVGRYYVGGLLAENETTADYADQGSAPYELPNPTPITSLLSAGEIGLVYLDVWQRHVTLLDDPAIHEVALGEADTTTRARTAWQVKVLPLPNATAPVACNADLEPWNGLVAASTGTLAASTHVGATEPKPCEPPPSAGYTRLENQLYRVEIHRGTEGGGTPTFKWSRDNGSIVTDVLSFEANDWITVGSLGRDEELGFANGQWVELVSDVTELCTDGSVRGQLTTIVDLDPGSNAVRLADAPTDTDLAHNPRLRRWDMVTVGPPDNVTVTNDGITVQTDVAVPLEDGIEITFSAGTYRDGDYWLLPARTATGDIEWPRDGGGNAIPQPPAGPKHYYCRLGFVQRSGAQLTLLTDCRAVFPPLTQLTSFFYVGGDGQEVMPDPSDPNAATPVPLPEPLEVGVANGAHPVPGATVRFEITNPAPAGTVDGHADFVEVSTGADGIASCTWAIASDQPKQQVRATLRVDGGPSHLPIDFSAQRSRADEVRYFPPQGCATLAPAHDVQAAIDRLGELVHLSYVSGDAQEIPPADVSTLEPIVVRAWSACGPIVGATVTFSIVEGNGSVTPATATTDATGSAQCDWVLDATTVRQRALATLTDLGPNAGPDASIHVPTSTVEFAARLDLTGPVKKPRVVRVRAVVRGDGKPLVNDADVQVQELLPGGPQAPVTRPGITIVTTVPVDPARLAGKKTVASSPTANAHPNLYVTVELPWPHTPADRSFWGSTALPLGFQPIVLSANVVVAGTEIRWIPTQLTRAWLDQLIVTQLKGAADRLLARLTLKGAFIRDEKRDYLDGEPFGPRTSVNDNPESGDGNPGGDFELWFWLIRSG